MAFSHHLPMALSQLISVRLHRKMNRYKSYATNSKKNNHHTFYSNENFGGKQPSPCTFIFLCTPPSHPFFPLSTMSKIENLNIFLLSMKRMGVLLPLVGAPPPFLFPFRLVGTPHVYPPNISNLVYFQIIIVISLNENPSEPQLRSEPKLDTSLKTLCIVPLHTFHSLVLSMRAITDYVSNPPINTYMFLYFCIQV